ncbi:MAG TPA: hypothetical protein VE197_08790 [Mycobacterium sp.]|nr:hypothetical protein [Mycobacterium sp.]
MAESEMVAVIVGYTPLADEELDPPPHPDTTTGATTEAHAANHRLAGLPHRKKWSLRATPAR